MEDKFNLEVEIARLQEKLSASDKALSLAEKLAAASTVAARAAERSQWSSVVSIISLLVALWAVFHGK
jgi:hypothetical protein